MIKFMVIGGHGFLGKSVTKHLITCCTRVGEIRLFDIKERNIWWNDSRINFIKGSIEDRSALIDAMRDIDVVFHCAQAKTDKSVLKIEAVNYSGTLNVINACLLCNVKCLIYAGSFCFNKYGDYFYRGDEYSDYYRIFDDTYAKTKHMAEVNVIKADRSKTVLGKILRTCSIQSFGVYGEEDSRFEKIFTKAFESGTVLGLCYNKIIQQSRTYVGNLAWMHISAYKILYNTNKADRAGGQIYFAYDYSPCVCPDDFDLLFLSEFNISLKIMSKRFLKATARINDLMTKMGKKQYFGSNELKKYNTYCVFETSKAKEELEYNPLYTWTDSKYSVITWLLTLI
ncbi:3-beta hydroxysteroid dehydrogenase/isomerase family [lymphocystis disease virus-China]|uniref:Hydroxysteroid dehydrogenase n=2 Tax=Lymphocystis disease virus 2 TaxID=159183 RepID=A0A6F8X359_9VIRU|nr:3-beta hydroxysteroid dehydrogenase/isomerase family [lymphocystis disease virus-China]AAS47817.1 3-beta hydroxysteroid dehydrogenase/isomerase family [lymphocystis disease virus-China]BCB67413.1 hydroxysteroid dehydrogenase [Lymphocystis disease virus 2]